MRYYNYSFIKFTSVFFIQNAVITLLVILFHLIRKYICIIVHIYAHACMYSINIFIANCKL